MLLCTLLFVSFSLRYALAAEGSTYPDCKSNLKADILFLVDASQNVDIYNFEYYLKGFVIDFVKRSNITDDYFRIAIYAYSSMVLKIVEFKEYTDRLHLLTIIDRKLNHMGDMASIDKGFRAISDSSYPQRQIAVKRLLIWVTANGKPLEVTERSAARYLSGIVDNMIVVSVGKSVERSNIQEAFKAENIYMEDKFEDLALGEFDIAKWACPDPCEEMERDINIASNKFNDMKQLRTAELMESNARVTELETSIFHTKSQIEKAKAQNVTLIAEIEFLNLEVLMLNEKRKLNDEQTEMTQKQYKQLEEYIKRQKTIYSGLLHQHALLQQISVTEGQQHKQAIYSELRNQVVQNDVKVQKLNETIQQRTEEVSQLEQILTDLSLEKKELLSKKTMRLGGESKTLLKKQLMDLDKETSRIKLKNKNLDEYIKQAKHEVNSSLEHNKMLLKEDKLSKVNGAAYDEEINILIANKKATDLKVQQLEEQIEILKSVPLTLNSDIKINKHNLIIVAANKMLSKAQHSLQSNLHDFHLDDPSNPKPKYSWSPCSNFRRSLGGHLVFRAAANSGSGVLSKFFASNIYSIVDYKNSSRFYVSPVLSSWYNGQYKRVVLELLTRRSTVVSLTFNSTRSNRFSWFNTQNILESYPWNKNVLRSNCCSKKPTSYPETNLFTMSSTNTHCSDFIGYIQTVDFANHNCETSRDGFPWFAYTANPTSLPDNKLLYADELRIYVVPYEVSIKRPVAFKPRLLFTASSGIRINMNHLLFGQLCSSPSGRLNRNIAEMWYRSELWSYTFPNRLFFRLYDERDNEVAELVFDTQFASSKNWFTPENLVRSYPWSLSALHHSTFITSRNEGNTFNGEFIIASSTQIQCHTPLFMIVQFVNKACYSKTQNWKDNSILYSGASAATLPNLKKAISVKIFGY